MGGTGNWPHVFECHLLNVLDDVSPDALVLDKRRTWVTFGFVLCFCWFTTTNLQFSVYFKFITWEV